MIKDSSTAYSYIHHDNDDDDDDDGDLMQRLARFLLQGGHGRFGNVRCLCLDNLINNTIFDCLLGGHEKIAIAVFLNLILWLITIVRNISVQHFSDKKNFLGLLHKRVRNEKENVGCGICGLVLTTRQRT